MDAARSGSVGTALVVEPSDELCDITSFFLRQAGFEVLAASTVEKAWEFLQDDAIDLVVAEVQTPNAGGLDLLERIKERDPVRPAVILTSYVAEAAVDVAFARGGEAVFSKPIHFAALNDLAVRSVTLRKAGHGGRSYRVPVNMELLVGPPENRRAMSIVNIHAKGVFIAWGGGSLPTPGESFDFSLPLQQTGYGGISGRFCVRWIREEDGEFGPRGVGARIDNMTPIHASYLTRVVNAIKTGILRF